MPFTDVPGQLSRLRVKVSQVPGEPYPSAGLRTGELAMNAADGRLYARGPGGSQLVLQGELSPYWKSANAESWPVFRKSMEDTVAEASQVPPSFSQIGTGAPINGTSVATAVTLPDGENVFLSYRNNAPITWEHPCYLYNTRANTFTVLPYTIRVNQFYGAALLPNGRIFFTSWNGSYPCYVVEPYSGETTVVDMSWQPSGGQVFTNGCVTLPGGDIAIVPTTAIGKFVPVFRWQTNKVDLIPYSVDVKSHRTGQLMPDGRVIFFGIGSAKQLDVFDPASERLERVVEDAGFSQRGGGLMNDGRIMVAAHEAPFIPRVFDPSDNSLTPCAGGAVPGRAWSAMPTPLGLTAICGDSEVWLYDTETGVQETLACASSGPIMTRGGIMACGPGGHVGMASAWDKDFPEDVLLSGYLNRNP
jgi:hypothetical protein